AFSSCASAHELHAQGTDNRWFHPHIAICGAGSTQAPGGSVQSELCPDHCSPHFGRGPAPKPRRTIRGGPERCPQCSDCTNSDRTGYAENICPLRNSILRIASLSGAPLPFDGTEAEDNDVGLHVFARDEDQLDYDFFANWVESKVSSSWIPERSILDRDISSWLFGSAIFEAVSPEDDEFRPQSTSTPIRRSVQRLAPSEESLLDPDLDRGCAPIATANRKRRHAVAAERHTAAAKNKILARFS
ncbi:hypothetical protein B0H14DRAFT_3152269, partial [Mycena olivaceomarginata]